MTNISPRTWVLMGFALSLTAVIINLFVLSGINDKIKQTDDELSKLNASLTNQARSISESKVTKNLYKVLYHTSKSLKDDEKEAAAGDAIVILADSYKNDYIAANDISMSDAIRAENDKLTVELAAAEKGNNVIELARQGKKAEADQLLKEIEADADKIAPKTELGRTLYGIEQKVSGEASVEEDDIDILLRTLPVIKTINEQYLTSYQKKQERIKELQDRKSNLSGWQNIFTYFAVSLQLFGLMFLLIKDLAKETNEQRNRAAK